MQTLALALGFALILMRSDSSIRRCKVYRFVKQGPSPKRRYGYAAMTNVELMDPECGKIFKQYCLMQAHRREFLDTVTVLGMPDYNEFRGLEDLAKDYGINVKLAGGASHIDRDLWIELLADTAKEIYKVSQTATGTSNVSALPAVVRFMDASKRLSILSDAKEENALKHLFVSLIASFDSIVGDLCTLAISRDISLILALYETPSRAIKEKVAGANNDEAKDRLVEQATKSVNQLSRRIRFISGQLPNSDFRRIDELLARRNVFMHAGAIADARYLEAAGNPPGIQVGDSLNINTDYLRVAESDSYRFIESTISWIGGLKTA